MDAERLKLVDQLTRTLQVAESMDWQPERTWRSILKPLCGEDEDLVQEVIDNARFAMSGPSDEDFSKLIIQPLDGSYPELPRYRVVGILGHGGMGVVYKVHFQADAFSEFRALKMMKRVPNLDLGLYLSRFEKERKILAKLNHPNIINILDDGTIDGLPYLVMPLVPGAKRLDEYCSSNHLSLAERLALFRTVCSAVESAHGKNVTHRDIKPSNLLVSDSGFVMVVDWGLAIELLSGPLIPSVLGGTEGYASPEQKRGDKEITPSADIYSLGQVLSALVLDSPEYADASVNLIDAKVRAALDAVIFVATRPLPQDRFLTVAALAAKIDALISDLNRENASDTHRPRFFNALNRRKTASVAAGLIITGAAMLWWILPRWSGAINETQQTRITPSPAATTTRTTPHPLKMIPEMKVQERAGEK